MCFPLDHITGNRGSVSVRRVVDPGKLVGGHFAPETVVLTLDQLVALLQDFPSGLGVAYLLAWAPIVTNSVTLVLMLAGATGVLKALLDKRSIRCACLGTALNLPMTKVTLVEDLTMAAMAAVMLAKLTT